MSLLACNNYFINVIEIIINQNFIQNFIIYLEL